MLLFGFIIVSYLLAVLIMKIVERYSSTFVNYNEKISRASDYCVV